MCETYKAGLRFFLYLSLALLPPFIAAGALQAEEPGPWYLISEQELRSIEISREKYETDRQSWLSQVQGLNTRAANLRLESRNLSNQLTEARELQRRSEQSFNEYEKENLTLLSSKNGEIAELRQIAADQKLEIERGKRRELAQRGIIIALAAVIAGYIAFKVLRFFRVIPV